tara:strand:- start:2998 stop:3858 length:861 start_codon:yes stop_codon:yes gene_type:complete
MAYGAYSGAENLANQYQMEDEKSKAQTSQEGAVLRQKSKMKEGFESQMKEAQARAEKKAKKNKGLFKALNFAGMFLGPAGQAITGGLSGLGMANQQKKAMKELMKGPQFDRYKGTFLGDIAKQQMKQAESMQAKSGAGLLSGLMGGLGGFMGGKALGGGAGEGLFQGGSGFFKGVKKPGIFEGIKGSANPMKQFMSNINPGFGAGKQFQPFQSQFAQNVKSKIGPGTKLFGGAGGGFMKNAQGYLKAIKNLDEITSGNQNQDPMKMIQQLMDEQSDDDYYGTSSEK